MHRQDFRDTTFRIAGRFQLDAAQPWPPSALDTIALTAGRRFSNGGDHGRAIAGPVITRMQIQQYRYRFDNPLIAAGAEEYEP